MDEIKIERTNKDILYIAIFAVIQGFLYVGDPDVHDMIIKLLEKLIAS